MQAEELVSLVESFRVAKEERLKADKLADSLKEKESFLKEKIIAYMREANAFAVGGKTCEVHRHLKPKPSVKDWNALYAHITATGEFDLLHRRLTEAAVISRWDDKVVVPGVEKFIVETLSVSMKE